MNRRSALSVLLGTPWALATGVARGSDKWFEDITVKAGVWHKHTNRQFENVYAPMMAGYTAFGAAAAVGDYDNDGFEDIFVTDSKVDGKNRLYHNNGDLTLIDVAEEAGVANGNNAENISAGALWLDYNNDGLLDLLVVRFGQNQLFQNLGGGKFREVTREASLAPHHLNAVTAIGFDYDHDGFV